MPPKKTSRDRKTYSKYYDAIDKYAGTVFPKIKPATMAEDQTESLRKSVSGGHQAKPRNRDLLGTHVKPPKKKGR